MFFKSRKSKKITIYEGQGNITWFGKSTVNLNIEGEQKRIFKYLWNAECFDLILEWILFMAWHIFVIVNQYDPVVESTGV